MFDQITILAPGLLGASLGMAAKASQLARTVKVWARREEVREACLRMDWCDAGFAGLEASVEGSELAIVCAPVDIIPELVEQIRPHLGGGALITDVGSTKAAICRQCKDQAGLARFVGSHPMAGSEKSGLEHARADLFMDRPCIVTPLESTPEASLRRITAFWEGVGMRVHAVSPEEHDRIVAHISHLPHLVASLLARQLGGSPAEWAALAGNGLRDTTRVAAGSPAIWRSIFANNSAEVMHALTGLEEQLACCKSLMARQDWSAMEQFLADGQRFRKGLE